MIGDDKNPAAVALGKLGGAKGGFTRAASLSPDRRRQIASEAATARWARRKELVEVIEAETLSILRPLNPTSRSLVTRRVRFRVLERDGFACRYCGAKAPEVRLEVDHVVPVTRGGTADESNLTASCYDCNRGKRDSELIGG